MSAFSVCKNVQSQEKKLLLTSFIFILFRRDVNHDESDNHLTPSIFKTYYSVMVIPDLSFGVYLHVMIPPALVPIDN